MRESRRGFVSFAEADRTLVEDLLARLTPHLRASRRFEHVLFECHELRAGERWHARLLDELRLCDYGLLCLSPAFLTSDYILTHELPPFLGASGKPFVPVGLKRLDFDLHDWHGLDAYQLMRLDGRFFAELAGERRDAFALELFRHIEARVAAGVRP